MLNRALKFSVVLAFFSIGAFASDLALRIPATLESRLDQTQVFNSTLHTSGKVSGAVSLSVNDSALLKISSDISVSISPAAVTLVPGVATDIPLKVTVTTTASSHSFQNIPVDFVANLAGASTPSVETVFVTVDPVYEIYLTGGPAPEGWNSPMTLTMPKHTPATTIRFVNLDTVSTHTIHGEGAIPHQDTTVPLAKATPGHPGGIYEIQVPTGDPVIGSYRCHDHEDDSMLRSISFNN
jgi:hypothetical protein